MPLRSPLGKAALFGTILLATAACAPQDNVPKLTTRIVDQAKVLSTTEATDLTKLLSQIDKEDKIEIVVFTMTALPEGESLEEYTNKVFNTWKIGKKDTDSGLLFVLVTGARKIRIEVGRGNEGSLPDMVADRIIKDLMAPKFKENKFSDGFREAILEVRKRLKEN